ncbi:MAG: hypothetical protein ABIA93_04780 [Candidatus Woesearchaeota archaeon]
MGKVGGILGWFAGEKFLGLLGLLEEKVDSAMDKAEQRLERATKKVIRASIIFLLSIVGFLFILVGLSKWFEQIWPIAQGMGLVIVGGFLIFIAIIARAFR